MAVKTVTSEKEAACQELKKAIGARKVRDDEITLVTHGRINHGFDPMLPYQKPSMVVFPETREDVVETLRIANKYKISVNPVGTAQMFLPTAEGDIILDQRRRDRIIEINTDSGYAILEPGVCHDKLISALRGTGYKCEVGTMTGSATVLAGGLGRGSKSFSNRHFTSILDLEVVLPDGTIFNTGSMMYDGVGPHLRYGPHPELAGLYMMSGGMFGVITKFAVRLHPINELSRVHIAGFSNFSDAVDYVKDVVNHNIPEHCIIWNWHMYQTWPLDPEGMETVMPEILKTDIRKPPEGTPYSMVTSFLSGYEEQVEFYENMCAKIAQKYHGRAYPQEEVEKRWPQTMAGLRQQYEDYSYREGTHWSRGRWSGFVLWAEPKDIKEIEKMCVKEFAELGPRARPINNYAHPFDYGRTFLFRYAGFPETDDTEIREKIFKKSMELVDVALKKYHAVPLGGGVYTEGVKAYLGVLGRIKRALDPNDILNRAATVNTIQEGRSTFQTGPQQ
jgi:FAD/FMN-containing dehydrogenase